MSKLTKLKCGCKVMENGWLYSECKYHKTHCHFGAFERCRKKLKKGEYRYCKEHNEVMTKWGEEGVDAYGGSDF